MPSAFITGISGQDGGYLAEQLLADGWQVHGLVHCADTARQDLAGRLPAVTLHSGDLSATPVLADLIREIGPDEIYNLGGISSVAYSWAHPVETAQINAIGAAGVLEAAWQLQETTGRQVRLVQASSAEMFGAPSTAPQTERTPLNPVSPYGASKAFAHNLIRSYRARGLAASSLILFNHESPRRPISFVTRKITHAVALIAAGKQDKLTLGTLDSRRDWGWAPDYVAAMVAAIRHAEADDYVIATGVAHSVSEFVAAAFARVGIEDWARFVGTDPEFVRPADAPELRGDAGHARAALGWAPSIGFEELVGRMVDEDLRQVNG